MNDVCFLIPTWLTATHALGSYNRVRKYYPEVSVFFIDDKSTPEDELAWMRIYTREHSVFDPVSDKLIGLPNSAYILKEHKGYETNGHGNAITYAMQFIHHKWVIHLSSDVRIVKEGLIEYLLDGTDDSICGIGEDFSRGGPENLGKWLCVFRGDLYHKFNLDFHGDYDNKVDAGTGYFTGTIKNGYKILYKDLHPYYEHLESKSHPRWEELYV